jgi:hypothetical protein
MASTVTNIFGATSTTEDVLSGIDLRGKRSRRAFLAGAIALTGVVSLPADEIISGGPYSSRQELGPTRDPSTKHI